MRLKSLSVSVMLFMTLLYTFFYSQIAIATPVTVGSVEYVRGVVSAKTEVGEGRLLGKKGSPIYETDSIVTGNTSFAVLVFKDGTKVTVRPKSVFVISEYQFKKNNNDKALFRLFKGGIRTITGDINNNKTENIKVETSTTSIAMSERNSDVVTRVCDVDCDDGTSTSKQVSKTVARIAFAKNALYVKDSTGKYAVQIGHQLKAKDTVLTSENGFAILVFADNTKVTLESATEFTITDFSFPVGRPKQGNVLLNLATGGARVLTGLIGKLRPEKFKLVTPVATMGVRGTGFDTYFDTQTYVNVWQGAVVASQNGRTQNIDLNQTFSVGVKGFQRLERFPARIKSKFRKNMRPDRVNTQNTWTSVKRGKASLKDKNTKNDRKQDNRKNQNQNRDQKQNQGQKLKLSRGESAVSNQRQSNKVSNTPSFISNDPYTSVSPQNVKSALRNNREGRGNQGQERKPEQGQRGAQEEGGENNRPRNEADNPRGNRPSTSDEGNRSRERREPRRNQGAPPPPPR